MLLWVLPLGIYPACCSGCCLWVFTLCVALDAAYGYPMGIYPVYCSGCCLWVTYGCLPCVLLWVLPLGIYPVYCSGCCLWVFTLHVALGAASGYLPCMLLWVLPLGMSRGILSWISLLSLSHMYPMAVACSFHRVGTLSLLAHTGGPISSTHRFSMHLPCNVPLDHPCTYPAMYP